MSSAERDRLARVSLSRLTEPGDLRLLPLVGELGAVKVHELLLAQGDLGEAAADLAQRLGDEDPARDLERAERLGMRFVIPSDAEWPIGLDDLSGVEPLQERGCTPLGLWVRGPLRLDSLRESVSIVGARSSTSYGDHVAGEIAATCTAAGWGVVSGAAFGIDIASHRGAFSVEGPTVAVLACGVDRAYPTAHRDQLAYLVKTGAVVSEAAPGWTATRVRFLARNRLIAALSRGTVIVEAAHRSGALNTANWADRLSRMVMGVPGPVTSAASVGVHQLIRRGATLVTRGEEVLELLDASGGHLLIEPRAPENARDKISVRHRQVLDAVPVHSGARADSIARAAGVGLIEVCRSLRSLETHGLVEQRVDGWRLGELGRA